MIRFVGFAYPSYDFGETVNEQHLAPRLPDGSPFTGAPSDSVLLFRVIANPGDRELRSGTYVLAPADGEERSSFARLRQCVAGLNPDRKVYCTRCGVLISATEPLCARCGARQFSIESLIANLGNFDSRLERQVAELTAARGAVEATASFKTAVAQVLSKSLALMPDRPSALRHILCKGRIWTTREHMSDEEFEALTQDDLDRKQARKRSAVARHKGSVAQAEPRRVVAGGADADPSYQTAPLADYSLSLQRRGTLLFNEVEKSVGGRAKRYDGSWSVLARSSDVTVAKIVIYQRGVGHENGVLPFPKDGVYVLVRTSGSGGSAIWKSGIVETLGFSQRLRRDSTVGIAPRHDRRFAYFEVTDEDDQKRIGQLLAKCSNF